MAYTLKENEVIAVRKGGIIKHVLQVNREGKTERLAVALCGAGPKENRHRTFDRAGWWMPYREVTCPQCLKILKARDND